jgi:hypothetical protein
MLNRFSIWPEDLCDGAYGMPQVGVACTGAREKNMRMSPPPKRKLSY